MRFILTLLFIMSYLNMHAKVTIGDVYFTDINRFEIDQSVDEISDNATIVIARNYKELLGSKVLDYIKPGKPVTIQCAYNDADLYTEFTGYVKPGIGADYPIEIKCDQLFYLRQNNFQISERSITLKNLLQRIAPGYTMECPDTQLGKVRFSNMSTVQILETIKKDYGFYSKIYNNILHVGYIFDYKPSFTKNYEYIVGKNVRDVKKLKFSTDIDFNTQVKVIIHRADGKREEVVYGMKNINGNYQAVKISDNDKKVTTEKASVKTYEVGHITTASAENIAKAQLKRVIYSGYTGSIDGFGFPQTKAGDSLTIKNAEYPEREGTYLIDKVKVVFEESHIIRENFISYKVA